jgi:hypothetical protein
MKTHRRVRYAPLHALTVTPEGSASAGRADSLGRAGRGLIILAFALGSVGAEAAAMSPHGDLASGHQPAGSIRLDVHKAPVGAQHITDRPWMY